MVYITPESVSVGDREILRYDSERGVLLLDISDGDLTRMLERPPLGGSLTLPISGVGTFYFNGVKRIERMWYQEGEPFIKVEHTEGYRGVRALIERIRGFFAYR